MKVQIFSDGACKGNPGPGGWACLLRYGSVEKELKGAEAATTNNRMEMTAALRGLQALSRPCEVEVYSDSDYLCKGMREWLAGWKARGWKTAAKAPVKNADLWQALDDACKPHEVSWHWVKGHNGHPENERVDALANVAIEEMMADERGAR